MTESVSYPTLRTLSPEIIHKRLQLWAGPASSHLTQEVWAFLPFGSSTFYA